MSAARLWTSSRAAAAAVAAPARVRNFTTSRTTLQASKVSALEFQLSTEDAVYRARLAALEQLLPTIKGRWGGIGFAVSQALGLGWMTDSEESVMRIVSSRAMYYPTWVVDAMWKVKCRGDNGEATASFISTNSAFPGNSWRPMDSLPIRAPPPRLPSTPERAPSIITSADEPMTYAPFSKERHLHPEVDIDGQISILPFNISPLCLPDLCKSADLRSSMVDLLSQGPALHINRRFTILPGVEIQVANLDDQRSENKSAMLRMEWDTLQLDMLACYPVMLPMHLVQFRYDAHGEKDRRATVALAAWDPSLLTYALQCDEQPGWVFKGDTSWLDVDMLDFDPRVPISPSVLDPQAKDATESSDARIIDLMAQQTQMQSVFEGRVHELMENANWSFCESWQREQPSSSDSAEARAGLGSHITWDDARIRPYAVDIEANRRYIALTTEEMFSARLLEGIAKDQQRGADLSHVQTYHQGQLLSGMYSTMLLIPQASKPFRCFVTD